jgi:hypothetical protein
VIKYGDVIRFNDYVDGSGLGMVVLDGRGGYSLL